MAKRSVKSMSVAELVALRDQVQAELSAKIERERADLQKQIDALTKLGSASSGVTGKGVANSRTGRSARKPVPGKRRAKVAPKYRGPNGETWTGRGFAPRWLAALEAQGKKRDSFLIKK